MFWSICFREERSGPCKESSHPESARHVFCSDFADLAFQVQDDILDVESDTETLGKQQGADVAANKPTYPAVLGMSGAKQKLQALYAEAEFALEAFGTNTELLHNIAQYIVNRNK